MVDREVGGPKAPKAARTQETYVDDVVAIPTETTANEEAGEGPKKDTTPVRTTISTTNSPNEKRILRSASRRGK